MKKIKNILYTCLLSAALFSCADNDMPAGSLQVKEGIPVTLTLSYQMLDDIKVTSRAADDEQTGGNGTTENKKPNDYGLQIFIFNEAGVLTGYKNLTETEFHYNESTAQSVKIETLTGKSYIYAVANYNSNRYKVNSLTFTGEKPDINREKFLKLTFERDKGELDISEDETKILMSGRYQDETDDKRNVNDDGSCTIGLNDNGNTAVIYNSSGTQDKKPIIYLKRVVSKVTFNITCSNKAVEFKPLSYEIHNITKEGNLLGYLPEEIKSKTTTSIEQDYVYTNFFTAESPNSFTKYIPENLQKVKENQPCTSWHVRETNTYDETTKIKSFINAPDNGTYVVIKGTYHDTKLKLLANVEYTIHLGDFGGTDEKMRNYNNFDNERNCDYTYNVTVKNANEITVEATKTEENKNPEYPGTEGLVINYSKGKTYTVDSHYEAVIMRIYKSENNVYQFMVETPWGGMSEHVSTNDADYDDKLKKLDVNWLSFALVSDVKDAIGTSYSNNSFIPTQNYWNAMKNMGYDKSNPKGGNVPFLAYTYTKKDDTDCLKSFQEFFNYLTKADNWKNNTNGYIDVICFIDEYYYSDKQYAIDIVKNTDGTKTPRPWNEYTNTTPRSFYLLETVAVSPDGHSTYMEVSHSISQYSIQTFYNPSKAKEIMAYGCEYINNEDASNDTADEWNGVANSSIVGTDIQNYVYWNGRVNTMLDIKSKFTPDDTLWKNILEGVSTTTNSQQPKLRWAFVDRNRDLDRDGKIDQDEIRWYTPTIAQYCGFWMGEDAIATEARLYNEKLSGLAINQIYASWLTKAEYRHYYTSTPMNRVFWAEEGFTCSTNYGSATGSTPSYVRCIRNLGIVNEKNNIYSNGVETITTEPHKFYTRTDLKFDLTNMDSKTLRSGAVLKGLLPPHAERQRDSDLSNNNLVRDKFELAQKRVKDESDNDMAFSIQEITQYGWYNNNKWESFKGNPIELNYTQDGDNGKNVGSWRIPNQRELCVIAIESLSQLGDNTVNNLLGDNNDACSTFCTNSEYRQGYYIRRMNKEQRLIVAMISNNNSKTFYIRPVRDLAE